MEKNTRELIDILKNTNPSELAQYESAYLAKTSMSFYRFIDDIIKKKKLKRQDIILKANLPQKYGYKLLSGETHTTDRNKILKLCFSMQMTLVEAQTALKLYGMSELYPKIKRDAMLIIAFNNKIFWIDDINEWLIQQGEEPLEE